ncbi:hypothetical protein CKO_01509 [Citrobacter koseri ATCC BAA-895]|uniref:Uncharacterized protein n=1 Tax=Citrobacter koseri (strain ATCC BAA-895 / CDC 4225-83 / SGSC4696) TaxID=290338 RepID=A8AGM9_CITK8|nr:hypothetical protein CKO_01509 [Citrobacter koseri ATCC BAA-895]KWZ97282.1 hypothetical protein HMPREF3220_03167 [Citrobacter koseri]KXA00365.1 hypothetical protein HMPREF3207_03672 [Citrobacter koseri]
MNIKCFILSIEYHNFNKNKTSDEVLYTPFAIHQQQQIFI